MRISLVASGCNSMTQARTRAGGIAARCEHGRRRLPPTEVPMSNIGAPRRIIEIQPIEEPAVQPAKLPEPAKVPEHV